MKNSIRFSPRMNRWFYSVFGVLFLSGALWLIVPGSWLLKIHGAAAMVSLVVLGVLIPSHMRRAWDQRRNRVTAVVMMTFCTSLIASGYGLYYFGGEEMRAWISAFHWIAGVVFPVALVGHIVADRRRAAVNSNLAEGHVKASGRFGTPRRGFPQERDVGPSPARRQPEPRPCQSITERGLTSEQTLVASHTGGDDVCCDQRSES